MPIDLVAAAEALAAATGAPWQPVGRLAGGETGAHEVRRRDTGERAVLKFTADRDDGAARAAGAAVSERLRLEASWPVPAVAVHESRELVLVVQQFCPGSPAAAITAPVADQLVALHARRLGLARGAHSGWADMVIETLVDGGDGYCLHEPLRAAGGRSRQFIEAVEAVGRSLSAADLPPATDLVHWDLHAGNLLVDAAGRLTAVIDTDYACEGDARFDLITVSISALESGDPSAPALLEFAGTGLDDAASAAYYGHILLRWIDWGLRRGRHAEVERWWALIDRTPQLAGWRPQLP